MRRKILQVSVIKREFGQKIYASGTTFLRYWHMFFTILAHEGYGNGTAAIMLLAQRLEAIKMSCFTLLAQGSKQDFGVCTT